MRAPPHAAPAHASRMVRAACVFIAATAILAGCNDAPAKAPLPTPSAPATTALVAPPELTKHQRRAGFLPLTILLPDADGWMTGRDEAQRYEASHAPSSSTLIVVGLDGTFGTSMQCAQNDRDESLPSELRIDGGLVRAPLALDVAYELFAKEAPNGVVVGTVRAHTAAAGKCYRLLFETRDRGRDAARETAARLTFFRDISLASLLLVRDGHAPAAPRTSLERR